MTNEEKNDSKDLKTDNLLKIQNRIDEYKLIENIHININHRNWEDTRKKFLRQNWYNVGYVSDIKIYHI